jgi:hypothetical protein
MEPKTQLIELLERALGELVQERCEILVKEQALRTAIEIIKQRKTNQQQPRS